MVIFMDEIIHVSPDGDEPTQGVDRLYPTYCLRRVYRVIPVKDIPWDDLDNPYICRLCLRQVPHSPVGVVKAPNLDPRQR